MFWSRCGSSGNALVMPGWSWEVLVMPQSWHGDWVMLIVVWGWEVLVVPWSWFVGLGQVLVMPQTGDGVVLPQSFG